MRQNNCKGSDRPDYDPPWMRSGEEGVLRGSACVILQNQIEATTMLPQSPHRSFFLSFTLFHRANSTRRQYLLLPQLQHSL